MREILDAVIDALSAVPLAGLMLVVTFGFIAGRVGWRGVNAGPGGGTLAVALLAGYLGLSMEGLYGGSPPPLTIGMFGFALFVYSIGFDAGPQFLSSLRAGRGWKFALIGALMVALSVALTLVLARLFDLDASTAAGALAGGLTSPPTFAAASAEAADSTRLSLAFALTFPFGLLGLVLMIQLLPRLTRTDLSRGARSESEAADETRIRARSPELTRAFLVTRPEVMDKPLRELNLTGRTGCFITRIHRGPEVMVASADSTLQADDHVLVNGRLDELQRFAELIGPEVYDQELRDRMPAPRRVHVTARQVVGRTLRELDLIGRHHCMIQRIERGRESIEPGPDVELLRHDVVDVVGQRDAVRAVAREFGRFDPDPNTTDIAIYAGGIVVGLLIGSIHFRPFGLDFTLGLAGGLLLTGVLLAWLKNVGPISANVPPSARQLVRDLGILLFVGETGLLAGYALRGGLDLPIPVPQVLLTGAVVTIAPAVLALALARLMLRLRPVDVWGSIAGGMTSTSALATIKRAADSNEPAISYAAAFAVASVLVTVAGQVVVRVLG